MTKLLAMLPLLFLASSAAPEASPTLRRLHRRRAAWLVVLAALAAAALGAEYRERRGAAEDAAARQLLGALHQAEQRHRAGQGAYARLDALRAAAQSPVGEGERRRGYVYTSAASADDYTIVARPTRGRGDSYTMDATGHLNHPPLPRQRTPEERLAEARQRARQRPDDARAWLDLVAVLRQMDRTAEALHAARRAARVDPPAARDLLHEAILDHADALLEARKPREALRLLREPAATDRKDPSALALLGDAYRALGQTSRAADAYRQSIAAEPLLARAWFGLAQIQEARGQRQEAMSSYLRVISIGTDAAMPDEWKQTAMEALSRLSGGSPKAP
ncbi:MAG: tetratricopeptide repeat protein [Armatimonadetes bacterium]|nr:tetratricopeptide repeat protein [Armatimonadota bacterium]